MLIRNVCAIALYCQHCGSIHIHDIPFFAFEPASSIVCESCGHEKARLLRLPRGRIAVEAACVRAQDWGNLPFQLNVKPVKTQSNETQRTSSALLGCIIKEKYLVWLKNIRSAI